MYAGYVNFQLLYKGFDSFENIYTKESTLSYHSLECRAYALSGEQCCRKSKNISDFSDQVRIVFEAVGAKVSNRIFPPAVAYRNFHA